MTSATDVEIDAASRNAPPRRSGLRPEIQLLRAVAVLAVVFNHLVPSLFPGGYIGVDIFFVISGYLITAHLLRELDGTGRVRLGRFWARRARRVLPAALLVLPVTAVATVAVVPATLWQGIMREVTASALYYQNWALAHDATDYFASTEAPSPITHYWSLSVEEQFYLLWPLLLLGAYVVGRRLRHPRPAIAVVVVAVVAVSLAHSVHATSASPSSAYFVTPTRMWQLGLGGLLALLPPLARGRHLGALVGWGLVAGSIVSFDEEMAVPGWIALFPVAGTAVVIWAGNAFLSRLPRPLRLARSAGEWVGGISYSLYLWHWPMIALAPHVLDRPLTTTVRLLLLVAMFPITWLSARLVEDPIRTSTRLGRSSLWATFVPAAAAMAVVVAFGSWANGSVVDRQERVEAQIDHAIASGERCFGPRAIANDCAEPHVLRYPDSTLLTKDTYRDRAAALDEGCMQQPARSEVLECDFGAPAEEATKRVVLVGDSHARQWVPTLDAIASEHDWHVRMMAKASCPANAAPVRTRNFPEWLASCREWNRDLVDRIAQNDSIDVVVTSSFSRNYVVDGVNSGRERRRSMAAGFREHWQRWAGTGKKVVVIGDPPLLRRGDIPSCVVEAGARTDPCTAPRAKALAGDVMLSAALKESNPEITAVDASDFFCDRSTCHAVIGGVVAYSDENHISGFFARPLAPYLFEDLNRSLR